MRKIKKKIKKNKPVIQDDNYQFKSFVIIVVVLIVLSVIFYIITNFVITNDNKANSDENEETSVNIQSEKILMGQLLNRPEETYYVLASLRDDQFLKLYDTYLEQLKNSEEEIKVYKVDLDEGLNKKYVNDEINITNNLNDLSVNDTVLFIISNNKIDSYYVGNEQIVEYLKQKINE